MLIESHRDLMEKHQSMIAFGQTGIFLGRPFEAYVANISVKLILYTKIMVIEYGFIALDYITHLQREEQNADRQKETVLAQESRVLLQTS